MCLSCSPENTDMPLYGFTSEATRWLWVVKVNNLELTEVTYSCVFVLKYKEQTLYQMDAAKTNKQSKKQNKKKKQNTKQNKKVGKVGMVSIR